MIQRYELKPVGMDWDNYPDANGTFVLYSDHLSHTQALQGQVEELRVLVREWREESDECPKCDLAKCADAVEAIIGKSI